MADDARDDVAREAGEGKLCWKAFGIGVGVLVGTGFTGLGVGVCVCVCVGVSAGVAPLPARLAPIIGVSSDLNVSRSSEA